MLYRLWITLFSLISLLPDTWCTPLEFEDDHYDNGDDYYAPSEVPCPERCLIRDGTQGLNPLEQEYISKRIHLHGKPSVYNFLHQCQIPEFELNKYILETKDCPISIGISISGGGYRSLLIASGVVQKIDEYGLLDAVSYITSVSGGSWLLAYLVLQDFDDLKLLNWDFATSLLKGVPNMDLQDDGGEPSDFVEYGAHAVINDFLQDGLTDDQYEWLKLMNSIPEDSHKKRGLAETFISIKFKLENFFQNNNNSDSGDLMFDVDTETDPLGELIEKLQSFKKTLLFYETIHEEVKFKKMKGFPLSFTDYWGRALSRKMSNTAGAVQSRGKLHDIVLNKSSRFKNNSIPFPIFVANCKNQPSMSNVLFEFTPYEFGSWFADLNKFMELEYLGSHIQNGKSLKCYTGVDDIGFIAATSSSLFNNVLAYIWEMVQNTSKGTFSAISFVLSSFGLISDSTLSSLAYSDGDAIPILQPDYAVFQPNPFYSFTEATVNDTPLIKDKFLYLVDGGEDGENIPLRPLLMESRGVDLVLAIDSSSDQGNLPNGKNLHNTYRHFMLERNTRKTVYRGIPIEILNVPKMPPQVDNTSRPTAFGCHVDQYVFLNDSLSVVDSHTSPLPPIILYIPNNLDLYQSNTSTFKLSYTDVEVDNMVRTGQSIMSHGDNPDFEKCLGCFIIKRRFDSEASSGEIPPFCEKCFAEFCFN